MASRFMTYAALAGFLWIAAPLSGTKDMTIVQYHAMPEAKAGRLEYTKNCGWIDWGHAIPDGPKQLIDMVMSESGRPSADKNYYELEYRQDMKKDAAGSVKLVALVSGKYKIRRSLNRQEKAKVAYAIFYDISRRFEEFQGSEPCRLVSGHSSFAEEDLTSNLLGFDMAAYGSSSGTIKKLCLPVGKRQSIRMIENGEYGKKNKTAEPIQWNKKRAKKGKLPKQLQPPKKPNSGSYNAVGYNTDFYYE